ncbi:MAG: hypothetical protein KAS32_24775, partial [Candidatus Peribacteraceae bacterium]|nr:hypothetical protein [Candidatus Peribacteraceae bacterium]
MNNRVNEIASMAYQLKVKRKDVFYKLINLLAEGTEDPVNNDDFLATIYAYFLPPVSAKSKTPDLWVAKAMAKDVRYYLNFVYSDGERLMATDGHRLHVLITDKYEPGYYD